MKTYFGKSCFLIGVLFILINNLCSQNYYLPKIIGCEFNNDPIEKVLLKLSALADVNFSYNSDILHSNKITYKTQASSLDSILRNIFSEKYQFEEFENHIIILKKDSLGKVIYDKIDTTENVKVVKGQVIEWASKNPIPFAHIYLSKSNTKTITNTNGEFKLTITDPQDNDTLMISFIGYRNFSIYLKYLDTLNTIIELKPETYKIEQVIIKPYNPKEIIKKAVENISENYDNKSCNLIGFFRETNRLNNEYISISEAVVSIYKSNYAIEYDNDKIKILKGRKNQNLSALDEYDFKVIGGLYNNLKLDIVKNKVSFINSEYMNLYDYYLEKIITYRNRNTFVISFDQKENVDELLYKGKLYIDEKTYAIVSAEFQISPKAIQKASSVFVVKKPFSARIKPVFSLYKTDYFYQNGKWQLNNAKSEVHFDILNKRTKNYSNFSTSSEFIITDKILIDVKKFRPKETSKPTDVFVEQINGYDEEFWGKYNIIQPDQSLIDAYEQLKTYTIHLVSNIK